VISSTASSRSSTGDERHLSGEKGRLQATAQRSTF
jgi:hypothetical protein